MRTDIDASVTVTDAPLNVEEATRAVTRPDAGAICTFLGVVRDHNEGRAVERLHYEAYVAMATTVMADLVREARGRWSFSRALLAHRTGTLTIGEASVLVAVSAPHRSEAFAVCRHLIDRLKEEVPIWKKEFFNDGSAWLEGPGRLR